MSAASKSLGSKPLSWFDSLEKKLLPWLVGAGLFGYIPALLSSSLRSTNGSRTAAASVGTLLSMVAFTSTTLFAAFVSLTAKKQPIDTVENLLHHIAKKSLYLYLLPLCVMGFSLGMLALIPFVRVIDQTLEKYATKSDRTASSVLMLTLGVALIADITFEIASLFDDKHASSVEDFANSSVFSGLCDFKWRTKIMWCIRTISESVEIGMLFFEQCLMIAAWHSAVCFKRIANFIKAVQPHSAPEFVLPRSIVTDHDVLAQAVERFDKSIGLAVLGFYSQTLIWLLYEVSKIKASGGPELHDIVFAFWELIEMLLITTSMIHLHDMALEVPGALRERLIDIPEGTAKMSRYLQVQHMTTYAPKMTLAGMVPITREFLGMMFGVMVAYTLLLWSDDKATPAMSKSNVTE